MTQRVLNKRRDPIVPGVDIYIGRGSPWGNPFKIGRDGDRDEVCDRFEREVLPTLDLEPLRGKTWFAGAHRAAATVTRFCAALVRRTHVHQWRVRMREPNRINTKLPMQTTGAGIWLGKPMNAVRLATILANRRVK